MAETEVIPSIFELDYTDLTFYQHPPCMFILWYMGLAVNGLWDIVKDLIDKVMGEGGDGGGGEGGEKKEGGEAKPEGESTEAPPEGEGGEPPAEEPPAEDAPPEEAPAEEG